jgi:hypothetical protein
MADQLPAEIPPALLVELTAYVTPGARSTPGDDTAFIQQCLIEAWALVGQNIGTTITVPDEIRDRAVLECGSELFARRQSPSGVTQYADATGAPVRLARDPMTGARAILAAYLPLGFA